MPNWKKLIVSGSDANLNSLDIATELTASDALITNDLDVLGKVGIGTTTPSYPLQISKNTVGNGFSINIFSTATKPNAQGGSVYSGFFSSVGNSSGTINDIVGSRNYAEHTGTGQSDFVVGSSHFAIHNGSGNSTGIYSIAPKAEIKGTGTGSHSFVLGVTSNTVLNNPNATVEYLRGVNINLKLTSGEVTDSVSGLVIDADGTGATLSGDFEYLRITNDTLPSVTGYARSINSLSTLPSFFSGSIGIGTTNPTEKLQITGNVSASGDFIGRNFTGSSFTGSFVGDGSGLTNLSLSEPFVFNATSTTGIQSATNTASGPYSTAMGRDTEASGPYSTAMGENTLAIGSYSTAMGRGTSASGPYSTAMGRETNASGYSSTAMGRNTLASGYASTAMGFKTTASGDASTAIGYLTTASGTYSTAMGRETNASGQYSTAMGYETEASGNTSTAMGRFTTASGYASTSIGQYNVINSGDSATTFAATNTAFSIGNGTGNASRSNALSVLFNGNTTSLGSVTATSFVGDGSGLTGLNSGSWDGIFTGSAQITGSLGVTGSVLVDGNVGIGTTNPSGLLHVSSGTSGDAVVIIESDTDNNNENDNPQLQFKQDGGATIAKIGLTGDGAGTDYTNSLINAAYFGNDGPSALQLYTDATARLTIEPNGDVGIGTNNPARRLQVAYNSTTAPGFSIKNTNSTVNNNVVMAFNRDNSDSLGWTQGIDSGDNSFKISEDGDNLETNPRIVILAGGNVGIGTTSPSYKLSVSGGILAGGVIKYSKAAGTLNTTGFAVAGLTTSSNGQSAGFTFTCYGDGAYQKVVYSCKNDAGTWKTFKVIDEGTNRFDIEASADSTTITFTFKSRSGTVSYTPRVTVEATGTAINNTYA